MFGGHLGLHFNRWIGLEGEVAGIPTKTRDSSSNPNYATKMWVFAYRGSVVLHLSDNYMFQPFLLAGYGGLTSLVADSTKAASDNWGFLHAGAGFKLGFTPFVGMRIDGRIISPWTALSPVIPKGNRIGYTEPDFEVFGGIYLKLGEVEKIHIYSKEKVVVQQAPPGRPDRDGDNPRRRRQKCPDQPEDKDGFQDDDGCPDLDNDGDGIPDALDKCPNEPRGQGRLRGPGRLPRSRQRPRRHSRRARQVPQRARGQGRLPGRGRLPQSRQRWRRHPQRDRQVPQQAQNLQSLSGRRRLPGRSAGGGEEVHGRHRGHRLRRPARRKSSPARGPSSTAP